MVAHMNRQGVACRSAMNSETPQVEPRVDRRSLSLPTLEGEDNESDYIKKRLAVIEKCQFVAMDKSGDWYAYAEEPRVERCDEPEQWMLAPGYEQFIDWDGRDLSHCLIGPVRSDIKPEDWRLTCMMVR